MSENETGSVLDNLYSRSKTISKITNFLNNDNKKGKCLIDRHDFQKTFCKFMILASDYLKDIC